MVGARTRMLREVTDEIIGEIDAMLSALTVSGSSHPKRLGATILRPMPLLGDDLADFAS